MKRYRAPLLLALLITSLPQFSSIDPKQRKTFELFKRYDVVTAKQIGDLFGFQPRTNAALCNKWVEGGFLEIIDYSNKARKYKLAVPYDVIMKEGL